MRYLLFILLIIAVSREARAQSVPFAERYDSVIYEKVRINGVPMSGTKKDILKIIGKPQRITRFVSDATTDHWLEYRYGSNVLQVAYDGSFYGFRLRSRAFSWIYGADTVRVGDSLKVLCNYFPASCRTLKAENLKAVTPKAANAGMLRVRCQATDGFIHFLLWNNVIVGIETWQDI